MTSIPAPTHRCLPLRTGAPRRARVGFLCAALTWIGLEVGNFTFSLQETLKLFGLVPLSSVFKLGVGRVERTKLTFFLLYISLKLTTMKSSKLMARTQSSTILSNVCT